jgi:hypothetical protein
MKRVLTSCVVALALAAVLGVSAASAHVDVKLNIKNLNNEQQGNHISAATGERVKFTLTVKNLSSRRQQATVTVVGGIPGCMITEVRTVELAPKETKKEFLVGEVPVGESGLLTVSATAVLSDGNTDSDNGSVLFGPAKLSSPSGSIFKRIYVQMLVRGLLAGLASDDEGARSLTASMSDVKSLYR